MEFPSKQKKRFLALILAGGVFFICSSAQAGEQINGDPYVDELLTNGVVSQSQYWSDIKALLTCGKYDEALKKCKEVMARRPLDIDMHCLYAMALEMKLRANEYDDKLFLECVKEWTRVAKVKILAQSNGWEHVGDGEVFIENPERKVLANRHLVSLVGRAPKYFESEDAFLKHAMEVKTEVAGKLVKKTM